MGAGKIRDKSQRCPIEGLKMADYIPCPTCGGCGQLSREFYSEKFKEYLTNYENQLQSYREEKRIFDSIKNKLNKEELEWIVKKLM
jgi:cytidine deaminase